MNNMYGGECIVPINEIGIKELDDMSIENSKNRIVFKISQEETDDFFDIDGYGPYVHFFDLDSLAFEIDMAETGLIPYEYLVRCLAIMQQHSKFPDGAIASALKAALNYGTCVEVAFK